MADEKEKALEIFSSGCNCSQAVVTAFAEHFGIDADAAKGLARAFGGGVARQGGRCGALNGALMVLGLIEQATAEEKDAKERTYERVQAFQKRFIDANGALDCRDILGVDLSQPGGHDEAVAKNLFKTVCHDVVGNTVSILENTLEKEEEGGK